MISPGTKAERRRKKATIKRAAALDPIAVQMALAHIAQTSRSPESDRLKLFLSLRAGMRAAEIAEIPLQAMLQANGLIDDYIDIHSAKKRGKNVIRTLAMHDQIRDALAALLERYPEATHAAFSIARDGSLRRQSASCVVNFFARLYRGAGLEGCSSHSGRRAFATEFAKRLGTYDGSIKDLKDALGHVCMSSTECYLDPSNRVDQLVRSLGT